MAQNFLPFDRDQPLLLLPRLDEWLPDDHLAWFVIEVAEQVDLEAFYSSYRADGHGRAAHDPKMMVGLLLYAYAIGERSSRKIEKACLTDVAFRILAANRRPDHATIARFRARHEEAFAELFTEVLRLCNDAGLVSANLLAVDGTKIAAAASERNNMGYRRIAEKILGEAAEIDAEEDELYGDKRGDELPERVATKAGRRGWIRAALDRQHEKQTTDPESIPKDRTKRAEICRDRLRDDHLAVVAAHRAHDRWLDHGTDKRGFPVAHKRSKNQAEIPEQPEGKINLTDPDSRNLKHARGWVQGYNAQAISNESQIILANDVTNLGQDFRQLEPMTEAAVEQLRKIGSAERPQVVLADAGYWSNEPIDRMRQAGWIPVVAPDADPRKPRKNRQGGPYDYMRRVLATPVGEALYKQRQWMIEPVFAEIKDIRRAGRFKRRGLKAARSEWNLLTATHNLLKLHRHHLSAATG